MRSSELIDVQCMYVRYCEGIKGSGQKEIMSSGIVLRFALQLKWMYGRELHMSLGICHLQNQILGTLFMGLQ